MANRLLECTNDYAAQKRKFFCAFLTLGYPDLAATKRLIKGFEKSGADIIELGFPFSDPLADGPTIQFSSEQAIKNRVRMQDAFDVVSALRRDGVKVPILFFSYFNPIMHWGSARFVRDAARAGFDGVVIPDLPPDEEEAFSKELKRHALCPVYLIAPTTGEKRMKMIAEKSEGFIYYVSLRGVTGARKALPSEVAAHIRKIKQKTAKPVLVGFGVSTPGQARELGRAADGVIVGSAIIEKIRSTGRLEKVEEFVKEMASAAKGKAHGGKTRP